MPRPGERWRVPRSAIAPLTPEAFSAILACPNLLSLRFEAVHGIQTGADAWAKADGLTTLTIDSSALETLDFLPRYAAETVVKLTDITVSGQRCDLAFDKYFIEANNVPSGALPALLNTEGRRWLYVTIHMQAGAISRDVIEALAGIGSLLSLDVRAVSPGAFTEDVWEGFPKLEQLKLAGGGTAPMGFLSRLPALKRLVIADTAVTQSGAIGRLEALDELSLIGCKVDDWAFLNHLPTLRQLTAAGCGGPSSLAFLAVTPRLTALALEDAPISDLSALSGRPLRLLSVYGCPVQDYAPLASLPSLALLACSEDAKLPPLGCPILRRRLIDAP